MSSGLSLIGTLGYYGAYVVVLMRTVSGALTLGTLTFLAASFRQSRDLIQGLLMSASGIYEQSLYLKDLFAFFDMQPTIHSAPNARAVPSPIREGFVFEDVGFRYPGSERWAVRHLSFVAASRRARRARRREWRGEDDAHEADRAALRSERRVAFCSTASICASTISTRCVARSA